MEVLPLIRVFVKGGLVSPADLLKIMEASKKAGNNYIMFGSRQDILFPAAEPEQKVVKAVLKNTDLEFDITSSSKLQDPVKMHNIASSYVGVNMMETTWWLKEDVYHYILDSIDYQPMLKVNIVDPIQSLVPLFTGHLNFIASREENYWYLYVRKKDESEQLVCWPELIHGNDIAWVAKQVEEVFRIQPKIDADKLLTSIQERSRIKAKTITESLKLPTALFPYYEGLNAMLNNLYWLGLYWRNNRFDIAFLNAACRLCQKTNVGKISITPWKSFVVKGIRSQDRIYWEKLMGRFGINLRHSSLELNWHLPAFDKEALELKQYLVRELDQQDISTHGLTLTIKNDPKMLLFTSVVIEKRGDYDSNGENLYNILYARHFNPNNTEYFIYAKKLKKEKLPAFLIELSKIYFRQLDEKGHTNKMALVNNGDIHDISSYQCTRCMTVYDKKFGDPEADIKAGTPFSELPDTYKCPVCSNDKKDYEPILEY